MTSGMCGPGAGLLLFKSRPQLQSGTACTPGVITGTYLGVHTVGRYCMIRGLRFGPQVFYFYPSALSFGWLGGTLKLLNRPTSNLITLNLALFPQPMGQLSASIVRFTSPDDPRQSSLCTDRPRQAARCKPVCKCHSRYYGKIYNILGLKSRIHCVRA